MNENIILESMEHPFVLDRFILNDVPGMVESLNRKEIYDHTCNIPHPYTSEYASDWVQVEAAKGEKGLQWAIRDQEGRLMGGVGFMGQHLQCGVYEFTDEIGYWLDPRHWGKGIMSSVVKQMSNFGFDKLNLERIEARVFTSNPASAKVLERCGYKLEGTLKKVYFKNGVFKDSFFYALLKS